ncbi:ParA family protein [Aminobacter sp. MET-1]|uniref:ParA family protein n=1 Tax=Aminobacter sp. MET-1 TaxID=2951085 RepID=UPI002269B087|nr:ParA family protein [Aminobacter sp. MET-1]
MAAKAPTAAPSISLALSTFKGGGGKTVLSLNLAGEFGSQGIKTLLIDCDEQQSLYRWYQTSRARKLLTDDDNIDAISILPKEDFDEKMRSAPPADIHIFDVGGFAHSRAVDVFKRVQAVIIPVILEATSATQAASVSNLLHQIAKQEGREVIPHAAIWNHVDHIAMKSNRAIPEVIKLLNAAKVPTFDTIIRKTTHFSDVGAGYGTLYTKLREIDNNPKLVPSAKKRARESVLDAIDQIKSLNNEFINLISMAA